MHEGFEAGWAKGKVSAAGVFNSLPLIIFGFMYQINVPALYCELKVRNMQNINTVLFQGTLFACFCYIIAGVFGYVSFAATTDEAQYKKIFEQQNILAAPYGAGNNGQLPIPIYISLFTILIVVTFATPFCTLPIKDSIENL